MEYIVFKLKGEQLKSVGIVKANPRSKQSSAMVRYKNIYKQQTGRRLTGEFLLMPCSHGGWYHLKKGKLIKKKRFYE